MTSHDIWSSVRSPLFLSLSRTQWNPLASLKAFSGNPLLKTTAKITLLYYTSVWAVVSTLMVYVARQFHFGPVKVCMWSVEGLGGEGGGGLPREGKASSTYTPDAVLEDL